MIQPNFLLSRGEKISQHFLSMGIHSFQEAIDWVHQLPYGRNRNRADYFSILEEKRGTCSTKHALLAALAAEHQQPYFLKLIICLLSEKEQSTIVPLLKRLGVNFFPEAHSVLEGPNGLIDITFPDQHLCCYGIIWQKYDLNPGEIGDRKIQLHRSALERFRKEYHVSFSLKEIWRMREEWIGSL